MVPFSFLNQKENIHQNKISSEKLKINRCQFSSVCPGIDHEFHQSIVRAALVVVDPQGDIVLSQ